MMKVKELKGHTARVLHMAASPNGTTVVSAAADETLRVQNSIIVQCCSAVMQFILEMTYLLLPLPLALFLYRYFSLPHSPRPPSSSASLSASLSAVPSSQFWDIFAAPSKLDKKGSLDSNSRFMSSMRIR